MIRLPGFEVGHLHTDSISPACEGTVNAQHFIKTQKSCPGRCGSVD